MARTPTVDDLGEVTEEVSVQEFLAHHRPLPHVFDVAPHMDPSAFQPDGRSTFGTSLTSTIRVKGERETDVRLLVDNGERYLTLANDLANTLCCDVYLSPRGARVRYLHESNSVTGDSWEAVAVDGTTGEPVEWLVVRPLGLPDGVQTWFTSARGRLRQSNGLVTVALPDGIAFATKATYRDTAHLATRLLPSNNRITTVAVNADLGRFEITRFDDAGSLLGGVELATLVSASLDVVYPDVQVALTWPKAAALCASLHTELMRFADALNRTVWVPQPQGAAFVLPGLGEFIAVDEVGAPSRWRAYPSRLYEDWTSPYGTDLDGRLAPLGEVAGTRFPGVPFVSVPAHQLEHLRPWYAAIAGCTGLFPVDLTVLPDGRLGVMLSDGIAVVTGPRELQVLLREAGWTGEDLLLLAQPPAEGWNTSIDHARSLVDGLSTDMWLPTLGAEVWVQADGTLAADGPDGADQAWCCVAFGRSAAEVTLPGALAVPRVAPHVGAPLARPELVAPPTILAPVVRPSFADTGGTDRGAETGASASAAAGAVVDDVAPGAPSLSAGTLSAGAADSGAADSGAADSGAADSGAADDVAVDDVAVDAVAAGDVTVGLPAGDVTMLLPVARATDSRALEPVSVALGRAAGTGSPHGVPWLPATPVANARSMDLYLWTPLTSDQIEAWGLPSADLFMLAGQDPLRLAARRPTGYLLRVRAPEHAAVDLLEHAKHAPTSVQQRLVDTGNTHLLPLAWLKDLRVTARFDLDGDGGVRARTDVGAGELAIRFEGADHGVPGLPNEVVHWPDKGQRADAPSYLPVPEKPGVGREIIHRGYVALSRKKPPLEEGHRLLEVKVRRRRAIDIPATLDNLAGLPVVGRMHDFVGLDLLLPELDLSKAVVTKIWRQGPGSRPQVDKLSGATLDEALADDRILATPSGTFDRAGKSARASQATPMSTAALPGATTATTTGETTTTVLDRSAADLVAVG